ncbi:nuclear protein 96-domain-containing protein [Xylariales sp. PMI_506]|nr:nuclear protein 96-domain-containing protein [Xylariales sp. PMI_506]
MSGFGGFGGFGSNTNNTSNTFGGFGTNTNTNTGGFGSGGTSTFGSTNTTGGGLFGGGGSNNTTAGGFGTGGGFGATNTAGAFGSAAKPAFGSTSTAGGGLFSSSTTATSGGGFGGFGGNSAPSSSTPFGGGASSGGLFGATANKPAFGSTPSSTTGGLFGGGGATNTTTFGSGSAFNAPASTALGGPVGDPPGTASTAFNPFVEKESATSSASNSFQNILFQDPYKKWSAEELRLADYTQGRRFGSGGGTSFGSGFGGFGTTNNAPAAGSSFGATNTGGGLFGSNTGTTGTGFGGANNTTSTFGSGGTGLFGNKPAATTGGGLFGGSSAATPAPSGGLFGGAGTSSFGNNTAATPSTGFGANTNSGGLFGANSQPQQNKPAGFSFGNNTASTGGFGTNTNTNTTGGFGANTTGGGLFGSTPNNAASGGGLFGGNAATQTNTGAFGSTGGFGAQNNQPSGGLFGAQNAAKPAGGLFGTNTASTGGGVFGGAANAQPSAFGNNAQASGGLFGNKPAATTTGGLFGGAGATQNTNTGGGLFGGLGNNQAGAQQAQTGGGLFGGLNNSTQQKPGGLFGGSTQTNTGGLFGAQNNAQQGGGLFGMSNTQQPQQNAMGSSLFNTSLNNQSTPQALTASVNDPSAYGTGGLFGNLGGQANDPGPLATPLSSKKQSRRPSVLPMYKLNPASASRFATPQKRGFGFSYSTYGSPSSPSSVASTPGSMSQSLLGNGSLTRSLGKSISTSNLRRSFNVEDSLLAPGAFSASASSRYVGNNSVKKLIINRELRSDLFSTPTKDKSSEDTPNGSRKLSKRVSFETTNAGAIENGDAPQDSASTTPSAEDLGYIRPSRSNGVNGSKSGAVATPDMEQVKGNELAIVHEEDVASPSVATPAPEGSDRHLGDYWMKPTKEEIQNMNRVQRQKVSDFTVGRKGSGWVKFNVPVDLTNIDLDNLFDNIVVLEVRSCTVYPNAAKKPAVGKGLNVPSTILLENSWPRASKTRGKAAASVAKHVERLKRIENTHFVDYNKESGEWTFTVDHFTTYGLDYDDEEDTEGGTEASVSGPQRHESTSPSSPEDSDRDQDDHTSSFRHGRRSLPGAFEADEEYDDEKSLDEMVMINRQPSFLANRSVGSTSKALVHVQQEDLDDEYAMSEEHEDASASLGHHLAAEQDDDSSSAGLMEFVQETPAGIMRARMRAIKSSATPAKVTITAGDDWMDMLQKTISPQKRDRALLKSLHEADNYRMKDNVQFQSPTKKRVVTDSRGFATSIDLMKSIFDQAKGPVERPQAPARPTNIKWPYKRMTKTLDENDMDANERAWHDSVRPTWGPNGTLVFAATPMESPFGRSGRITEKNGLMTVMKGGIVSESQDIRIAKFTNEMSARALKNHADLTEIYLDSGIPTALGPRVSLKDFVTDIGTKNPAGEHEKLVWELASVLFDSLRVPTELQNDPTATEKLRRENLSRFWEHMVDDESNKGIAMAGSSEEKALAALAGHRVAEACKHLLEGKDFRLATLISLIGTGDDVKKDMREQIKEWRDANVLSEFSEPVRALYEMLSGNVCACEGTKGGPSENRLDSFVISRKFGLNWKQAFGLRLWYATSPEDAIGDAISSFKADFDQDKEQRPLSWFIESGIGGIWSDPKESEREDLLWGLLQLYSDDRADLEAVLQPENSQLSPLDYRLSWQLGQALTATGRVSFGKNAQEKADAASLSFASQLTNEGSWLEATFVLLHLTDPDARAKAIQEHICRHAGQVGDEQSDSFKKLTEKFKIPSEWIWHAKALYMRSVKKDAAGEVQCLLRAESYAEAHRTFIKEVAPVAIIEQDYDALADLLRQFDGRQSQVPDWNLGGEVYKAFLQLIGFQRRHEQPPPALISGLLEGLPAMHGNTPEAGVMEYAALTDMAAVVAKVVGDMAKKGQVSNTQSHNKYEQDTDIYTYRWITSGSSNCL